MWDLLKTNARVGKVGRDRDEQRLAGDWLLLKLGDDVHEVHYIIVLLFYMLLIFS